METSFSKEIKVGVFALCGTIAFAISILLLGGDKMFFKSTYPLRVELTDVQGLARGSVVSLDGVPVGNIHALNFIPGSRSIETTLDIYSENRSRITEGSKASVKTQGALGDKYIFIEAGPLDGKPLADNSKIEMDMTGDLFDIITKKGAELGQIVEVIKEVRELFYEINKDGRSAKLMQNLVASSDGLKDTMQEAKETLPYLKTILKKIDRGDGTLGALINDPTLHTKMLNVFGGNARNKFLTPVLRDSIKESEQK
jgi:phospholipid/cholesterol/gamma-HCH transport system substrate-binding protein